jgi:antirestriction protein
MNKELNELQQALEDWKAETPEAREDTPRVEALIQDKTEELFAEWVAEHGNLDEDAYAGYADNLGEDLLEVEDWATDAEDAYAGEFYNDEEFAESLIEETEDLNDVPDIIRNNINWEGLAIDVMQDYFEVNGHYFRNH